MVEQNCRNWSKYNFAQTSEKLMFLKIINESVNAMGIKYEYVGNGRPRISGPF